MLTEQSVVAYEGASSALVKELRDVITVRNAEAAQLAKVEQEQNALTVIQNQVGGERGEAVAAVNQLKAALDAIVAELSAGDPAP